jgi:hypothetical protein
VPTPTPANTPTPSGPGPIDFDHLPSGEAILPNTTIQSQYHTLGVDFLPEYPAGVARNLPEAIPQPDAHSAPNVGSIRTPGCGGEFCSNDIVGQLEVPAQHLHMYVGDYGLSTETAQVKVIALGSDGNPLPDDTATVTVMATGGGGFSARVDVSASDYSIAYFEVSSGFGKHVAIDDLSFDKSPVASIPDFSLSRLLYPTILSVGKTVSTTIHIACLYGATGGINFHIGGLPPGVDAGFSPNPAACPSATTVTLTLTAHSSITAADATATIYGEPIDSTVGTATRTLDLPLTVEVAAYGLRVNGVEVTQGVQLYNIPQKSSDITRAVPYSGVGLAADAKTVVRVFASARFAAGGIVSDVEAYLRGYDAAGKELPGGPLSSDLGPRTLGVSPSDAVTDFLRRNPRAYTFTLPPSWTRGRITLRASLQPPGEGFLSVCDALCLADRTFTLTNIPFTPTQGVSVDPIALTVKGSDGKVIPVQPPTFFTYRCVKDCINNPYPTNVRLYHTGFQGVFDGAIDVSAMGDGQFDVPTGYLGEIDITDIANQTSCGFLGLKSCDSSAKGSLTADRLRDFADSHNFMQGDEWDARLRELVVGVYPGGQSIRGTTDWQCSGTIVDCDIWPVAVVQDSGRSLTSVAHEIYHMFGHGHASLCTNDGDPSGGQTDPEDWPPDQQGFIQGVGLDRWSSSGGALGYAVKDPGPTGTENSPFYDFMSYCAVESNAWISTRNWNATVSGFATGAPGSERSAVPFAPQPIERQTSREVPTLLVEAMQDGSQLVITKVAPYTGTNPSSGGSSPYHLIARDAAGHVLADSAVEPVPSHVDHGRTLLNFRVQVAAPGAARIEVTLNGIPLASRTRPDPAPSVQILSPTVGDRIGTRKTTVVRWRATGAPGTNLTTTLDYSTDDGNTWRPVYLGPNKDQIELPSYDFAASRSARVRVRVNDGFNETAVVSGRFAAIGAPPGVIILSPGPGQRIMNDASLYLSGQAYGDDGRTVRGGTFRWYAGRRFLGSGPRISVTALQPGATSIRLVVRDASGRVGSTFVGVQLGAAAPRFLILRAPQTISRKARRLSLQIESTIPATLHVGRATYQVDRRARRIAVRVQPGTKTLTLRLRLVASGHSTTVKVSVMRQ